MPNNSETPEIVFCASVLAKTVKLDDSDGFAVLHDALGKIFESVELEKVEELARNYSEIPICLLDRKINWLRSHGVEPIDVDAVFHKKSVEVSNTISAEKSGGGMQNSEQQAQTDEKTLKKKNKKNKKKKEPTEESQVQTRSLVVGSTTRETVAAEVSPAVIPADGQNLSDASVVGKRKKKKKKKKRMKSVEESNDMPEPKEQAASPQEPAECKSSEVTPVLDSGIGSCAASGGEDKSSVLSGGTTESAEGTEAGARMYSFEWDSNSTYVRDYLDQSEAIFFEKLEAESNNGSPNDPESMKNSKIVEMTFGFPTVENDANPTTNVTSEDVKFVKQDKKNNATKCKSPNRIMGRKYVKSVKIEETKDIEISFEVPPEIEVNIVDQPPEEPKSFRKFIDSDAKGGFDHNTAIKFLWEEWNRTIENHKTEWYCSNM